MATGRAMSGKPKRTANACVACRQSKIKCSGSEPCTNCERRAIRCRFVEGNSKVVVTERYLQELQRQARALQQSSHGTKRSADVAFGPAIEIDGVYHGDTDLHPVRYIDRVDSVGPAPAPGPPGEPLAIDHGRSVWTSPFTGPSRTIKNTYKNRRSWIWLAPTSVWSFTARLSLMMTEKLNLESPFTTPNSLDQEIYPLNWRHGAVDDPIDIGGLPSIDHALYLVNTAKFHLDQSYRLFDEDTFLSHIHEFYYGNALKKATECRLWFVQFLLVLAFGNAFLLQSRKLKDPPGSKFFVRAMSLMPDHTSLWKEGLLAIEVLALAGLYLYCIDHRESAHVYVGQAIRIAQLDGLHTELPEDELGTATVTRCRNLWWTLYMMDRHFSSSVGVPMTTQDSDITIQPVPPSASSQRDTTLSLQVGLSHLLSFILTSIYKNEKTELGTFLEKTRSILQTLAGHAQEIEDITRSKFQNSVDTMPKEIRHITLLYHQCVIVATRPLLLSVLKERLEKLGQGEEDWHSFLAPTKTLISTGIKSASKTLQILTDEDSLLTVFLPFELEFTYAAAIHLLMANTLFPTASDGENYSQEAHLILDEMIYKGNRLAEARKAELTHLEILFRELAARIEQQGLQTLTLFTPDQYEGELDEQTGVQSMMAPTNQEAIQQPAPSDADSTQQVLPQTLPDMEFLDNIGISSYDFLSLVNQMGNLENYGVLDPVGDRC